MAEKSPRLMILTGLLVRVSGAIMRASLVKNAPRVILPKAPNPILRPSHTRGGSISSIIAGIAPGMYEVSGKSALILCSRKSFILWAGALKPSLWHDLSIPLMYSSMERGPLESMSEHFSCTTIALFAHLVPLEEGLMPFTT